jgi:ATP-dependent phosphofructokinase / diphosphate-dependent phosphofructokinase
MPGKNVIAAQSGGPTPVINNSLRAVVETCRKFPETFGNVYAGKHGILGVLTEELIDLSAQPGEEISLLRTTPAAGSIGTCRYKLKKEQEEDFNRTIEVMKAHDVGYFFYIGGNDSMDTANKVAKLAAEKGLDLVGVGIPKTIDNDVGDTEFKLIDHTPGYGSVARYWALNIQNAEEENRGSSPADPVLVIQAMGRKIGFIPAAARLADPLRKLPLIIAMKESGITVEELAGRIDDKLSKHGRALVVVSEGFPVGDIGEVKDSFGHTQFSSSKITVGQTLVNYLNEKGIKAKGAARVNVPGTDQRHNMIYASSSDLEEAYKVGETAVLTAKAGKSGLMSTILRAPGEVYSVEYSTVPLEKVANSEREFPAKWISDDRVDVTDEFLSYARPLIGEDWVSVPLVDGIQRFARLREAYADKKCPGYTPQGHRK